MMDRKPLLGLAKHLREIADIVDGFAAAASDAPHEGGDTEPIEQVEAGFAVIRDALKGITTPGDHSAQYQRIEAALGSIANAIKQLGAGRQK